MKLISSWIIPVIGFKVLTQSIAPRQLVPVCPRLTTSAALGELHLGAVFRHKPRTNSQTGRIGPSKKDFQDSPLGSSCQCTVEGGCCTALPWHVGYTSHSLRDDPPQTGESQAKRC